MTALAFDSLAFVKTIEEASIDTRHDVALLAKDISDIKANMASRVDIKDLQLRIGAMIVALGGVLIAVRYFG